VSEDELPKTDPALAIDMQDKWLKAYDEGVIKAAR